MILYFDTETSGLCPGQICQLSYIMQDKTQSQAKNFFFAVDSVEYSAYMVHGFSVEKLFKLSGGKRLSYHIDEICADFERADLVVSHNTAFDFMFMRAEFERLGKIFAVKREFCSMKKMTPVCKLLRSKGVGYKYPKLSELCAYFGITDREIAITSEKLFGKSASFHDARFDTTAVYLAVNYGMDNEPVMEDIKELL
ncbi:MAG: 3'-5' exonuclease [Clostridia bacterium]|nr:3'-5' exonuclease [Clostridia bacterium]